MIRNSVDQSQERGTDTIIKQMNGLDRTAQKHTTIYKNMINKAS